MLNGNHTTHRHRGIARFSNEAERQRIYDYLQSIKAPVFAYDNKDASNVVADFEMPADRDRFAERFGSGIKIPTASEIAAFDAAQTKSKAAPKPARKAPKLAVVAA